MKLLIYIPTYNRLEKLSNCLKSVASDIKNSLGDAAVLVSNNCSTDGTREFLESLNYDWLTVTHQDKNKGAFGNIKNGFKLPLQSEFTWIIGDDDYLIPGAISGILNLITQYPQADYIFCNTKAFPSNQSDAILKKFFETGAIEGGEVKSKKYVGTALVHFETLIDPAIADTLLGELMCNCFRTSSVRFPEHPRHAHFPEIEHETADFNTLGELYLPHCLPLLEGFKPDTAAVYCDTVRTFNFWGSAEWLGDYDYVFPIVILYLISEYYRRGIINERKLCGLLDYYYSTMGPSLLRQTSATSSARPFNRLVTSEILRFLLIYTRLPKPSPQTNSKP